MALSMRAGQEPEAVQADRFWICEAAADDAPAVVHIIHAAYAEFQGKLDPPSGAHSETEASIRKLFETERCVIAGWGAEVAGCTFFHIGERDTYLHRLAVVPEHRHKALGHALVTFVETQARGSGSPRCARGAPAAADEPGLLSQPRLFGHESPFPSRLLLPDLRFNDKRCERTAHSV